MKRLARWSLALAVALALHAAPAAAQVVEVPVSFDTAGRVLVITPEVAVRLGLEPPAWRVTGTFEEARLYRTSDGQYVMIVTRPGGVRERFPVSAADIAYFQARTATLPPNFAMRAATELARTPFVLTQTLYGLTIYAPSFAAALTDETSGQVASYLLAAGASYFGASTLARDLRITVPMYRLSTFGTPAGALAGWGAATIAGANDDITAASIFASSLAGTAAGLYFARGMSEAEVAATTFGATAATAIAGGYLIGYDQRDDAEVSEKGVATTLLAAGLAGLPLGAWYAREATYGVTAGDIYSLWAPAAIGAMAGMIAFDDPEDPDFWYAASTGAALGLVAGDFILVRRFDHTRADAGLVLLGTGAGALMGAGVSVLVDPDREHERLTAALATVGAAAGLAASEYLVGTKPDVTWRGASLNVDPMGAAMAVGGVKGRHGIVRITF